MLPRRFAISAPRAYLRGLARAGQPSAPLSGDAWGGLGPWLFLPRPLDFKRRERSFLLGAMSLHMRSRRSAGFIEPCLPSPAAKPPARAGWLHEIKHNGLLSRAWDMCDGRHRYCETALLQLVAPNLPDATEYKAERKRNDGIERR